MYYKSGQIYTAEEKAVLIRRYAESMEKDGKYSCTSHFDFICDRPVCGDCDFGNENMKARHDKVMIALGRMKAPRVSTKRYPAKKDKQYKLTLKKLRGHNG